MEMADRQTACIVAVPAPKLSVGFLCARLTIDTFPCCG